MILINLLPPELRKRHGGVSPMFLSVVVGGVANLLLFGLWAWLTWVQVPAAERKLAEKTDELSVKTAEAQKVMDLEVKITEFKERRDTIVGLLAKKVYWAHALDDLATLLTGKWQIPGFEVRVQELNIQEIAGQTTDRRAGGAAEAEVLFGFKWRYKITGVEKDKGGDYIQAFFRTTERGQFWINNGFLGKPEDGYFGDRPVWNADINRVIVDGTLDWKRHKLVKAAVKAEN